MDAQLSLKETELVAVGASVAAGCIPCTQYHVKAVQTAGATADEVTRVLDAALRVKEGTRAIMQRVAREALGLAVREEQAAGAGPTDRVTALVSIAAAAAVNCPTSFRRHVEVGRGLGVRDDEIQLVVNLGKMIRAKAAEKMDQAVETPAEPVPVASCCGFQSCA
jgi:AhpD family alkylhydroperoxidase